MFRISEQEEILLSLLAFELFQREPQIATPDVDWASVLDEGTRHAVTALLYPGLRWMAGVPEEVLDEARGVALTAASMTEHMLSSQQTVLALLQKRDIPCAILKGTSIALHYPHPELRIPGDIDLLVDSENFQAACSTLEADGFFLALEDPKHLCFQKQNLWVEVHPMVSLFPDSEKGSLTKEYMLGALQSVQTIDLFGVYFPTLTGMYQILSLLLHMAHHISGAGIGLRQLCDWAVTVHAQREAIGEAELALLERFGLLYFAKIVTRVCEKYLGLPPCEWSTHVSDATVNALIYDCLLSGNFQSQNERPFWGVLTWGSLDDAGKVEHEEKKSVLRSYGQYIRHRIQFDYPWAKDRLWVPVFALFYPFRWIVMRLKGKRKQVRMFNAIRFVLRRKRLIQELRWYK